MESGDADSLQEFLSNFGKAYKNWVKSGQKVEKTADFGDSRGVGEKKHNNWVTVHEINTRALKRIFGDVKQMVNADDVALAKAAGVSPLELRKTRDGIG